MLDKERFNQIIQGLADTETAKTYYRELISLARTIGDEHPDAGKVADQIMYLEDLYKFKDTHAQPNTKPTEEAFSYNEINEEVRAKIDELIDLDFAPSQALTVCDFLAKSLKLPNSRNLERYYHYRKDQREQEDFKSEMDKDLSDLLGINKSDINVSDYLPDWLSPPLSHYCKTSSVKHLLVLLGLLSGVSVCHKVKTRLMVDPSKDWKEPPSLFVLNISPTGQGKSPFVNKILIEPLSLIHQEWKEAFNDEQLDYEIELESIKQLPKDERKEALKNLKEPPSRERIIFSTDPTIIGLNQQFNAYPEQGILAIFDEGSKLFAFDRTGSGKSDRADLLSFYNGGGLCELRLEGIRANVSRTLLSINAAIQPEVLLELMGNCEDRSGQWARFLYALQPKTRKYPSRNQAKVDVTNLLVEVYEQIMKLPGELYHLDPQAGQLFDDYYYFDLEGKRMRTNDLGLEAVFGKSGGQVARLALNLHILEVIANPGATPRLIKAETIEKAVSLYKICLNQIRGLYSIAGASQGELPPKLALIIERSKSVGAVTARDIKQYVWCCKKDDPSQIREWFIRLEKLGKGKVSGAGNRKSFTAY
ncbi:DUF3987 domain-containing protein [Gloeothece verrucosa]|uniref:DUF3987 domain-containing protein n=1 Tax=Gloeothece verrucosa (strain PCC 7822) TaxID=497965 RepID=E0UDQ5_GLOV7|nr:DUF3987 domain-containing protein [Gloeothece verrucosa]ADN16490.1 hypothetical protein Cyan7822_4581 [Gloeothece verrucosa PCC 7822]